MDLSQKYFWSCDEADFIQMHLREHRILTKDYSIQSTLTHAMRNADQASGLTHCRPYPALLTYLSCIEQMGNIYALKVKDSAKSNGIKRCLENFSNTTPSDTEVVYEFRNALSHNLSLIGIAQNGNKKIFRFSDNEQTPLVISPLVPWDGDENNIKSDCVTEINVHRLGLLARDCLANLEKKNSLGEIEVRDCDKLCTGDKLVHKLKTRYLLFSLR